MTPEQVLRECETLNHDGRMRRMVELGRLAATDASIDEALTTLEQGNVYQRILALQSCYGSRNSARVVRALADPSRNVRSLALNVAVVVCSDAELRTVFATIPLDMQDTLLHCLRRCGRQKAIDGCVEALAERGQVTHVRSLLPLASHEIVVRYLEQVVERFELSNWRRLAKLHPVLANEHLIARIEALTALDQRLLIQVNTVLPILAKTVPDLALQLVKAMLPLVSLVSLQLGILAIRRPQEVADLALQAEEGSKVDFTSAARHLDIERLVALAARYASSVKPAKLRRFTPQQRLALYTAFSLSWRTEEGVLMYDIVAALPTSQRIAEGRRNLALPVLATRPLERLRYAAFLPWDEAREILTTALRSPDAELRAAALDALVSTARYQRDHLAEVLQLLRARRNEQDPVRRQMLAALAQLPPGIWRAEHLDDLAQIIRDALDATDLSQVTVREMESLVLHMLPSHAEWCAAQMALLYRSSADVRVHNIDAYLSDRDMRTLVPALLPVVRAWLNREREALLVSLAYAFGRRLRVFPELLDMFETLLPYTRNQYVADGILHFFLRYRRSRLETLIPDLLQRDRSCITLSSVHGYLHRYRQDLLTPFLGQQVYAGRFSTGMTRLVLPFTNGFYRWTPAQQEIFARTLLEVARDRNHGSHVQISTIWRLAAMPDIDPAYLIAFARDEQQIIRDTALRALGRMDAGQGIPTLLEALDDERARVAIYALRTALLAMSDSRALNLLRAVPFTKVTVAKEVVRLIGDRASEAAYQELLAIHRRDLHRDVRVALLRALWSYTEQAETWEIWMQAAQSPDAALAKGVIWLPADGLSPLAQRRLATLLATVLLHPEPEVRIAVLQRCAQHPITDHGYTFFANLLQSLNSTIPDEYAAAAHAIFALYSGEEATRVGDALRRSLSNRKALQTIIETFVSLLAYNRRHLLPATRAILAVLAEDPLTLSLRIRVSILGLPWEEVGPLLVQSVDQLHADGLAQAQRALLHTIRRPDADFEQLEQLLATSSDERLRRLALTALQAQTQQPGGGWSDERIARLQAYREDPSRLVAEAAQFTFPS